MARPRKEIDLEQFEKLCSLQCTVPEIADFFGVSVNLIEKRIQLEEGYAEARARGAAEGKISIRRKQFQLMENGSNSMAIWLGKQYLGQRDHTEIGSNASMPLKIEVVEPSNDSSSDSSD